MCIISPPLFLQPDLRPLSSLLASITLTHSWLSARQLVTRPDSQERRPAQWPLGCTRARTPRKARCGCSADVPTLRTPLNSFRILSTDVSFDTYSGASLPPTCSQEAMPRTQMIRLFARAWILTAVLVVNAKKRKMTVANSCGCCTYLCATCSRAEAFARQVHTPSGLDCSPRWDRNRSTHRRDGKRRLEPPGRSRSKNLVCL